MRKANFFIVGSPKCGTTALRSYLLTHEDFCFTSPKEPNFFATDFATQRYVCNETQYEKLFDPKKNGRSVLGDASAWYLYSKEAITNIHRYNKNAKFVILIRNPVDMVPSLHGMLLRNFAEHEKDVEKAWRLQARRTQGKGYSRFRNKSFDKKTCLYKEVCSQGVLVERALDIIPRSQVLIINFDDFVRNTQEIYNQVLEFLGVSVDGRDHFPPENVRRQFRSRSLAFINWKARDLGSFIKRKMGILTAFDVLDKVNSFNHVPEEKPILSPSFKKELQGAFYEDVLKLQDITELDLSKWLLD